MILSCDYVSFSTEHSKVFPFSGDTVPQSPTPKPVGSDRLPAEDFQVWSRMRDLANESKTSSSVSPDRNRATNQVMSTEGGNMGGSANVVNDTQGLQRLKCRNLKGLILNFCEATARLLLISSCFSLNSFS